MSDDRQRREYEAAVSEAHAQWERSIPDARLTGPRKTFRGPLGEMVRTYCIHCGRPCGFVNKDATYVIVTCDPCDAHFGPLPLPKLPDHHFTDDSGG